jgi:excisionase family DNA binding protein
VTKTKERALAPLDISKLYSPVEAAPYLHMSVRMVVRRLDARHIGHVKIGRKRFISGAQILAYFGEHTEDPRPEHMRPSLRSA